MKREIKFRGKDVENDNQWRYGSLIQYPNGDCVIIEYDKDGNELSYNVKPDTVGQFTGLEDRNEKGIFEGDIIKFQKFANWYDEHGNNGLNRHVGKVIFENGCFCWEIIKRGHDSYYYYCHKIEPLQHTCETWGLEVFGNIYDNGELLCEK